MNLKCLFGSHDWKGCKCRKCGGTRDQGHIWQGCTCAGCGKKRDEGHVWNPDGEKCIRCDAPGPRGIERLDRDQAIMSWIEALKSDKYGVRQTAMESLGKLHDARTVEPLIDALLHAEHYYTREAAAEALGVIGDRRAVEPLITALQDSSEEIRPGVATALAKIGDARAAKPLIRMLQSVAIPHHRCVAAEALGVLGDPAAVEALTALLADDETDQMLRDSVGAALGRLRSKQ